ncbi:MAG: ShlB/FhaC/HecB family hemolysin secretion/activation protein [Pseudomonadota bacterium]
MDRSPEQVLALRAIFNVGIDAFSATTNASELPDGQFFYWLGQFQWLRRLWDSNNQVLIRSDVQLSADPLLSIEKFAIGGARTVRGYRENLLVRDSGFVASLEFRVPVFRLPLPGVSKAPEDGRVYLAPFYDFGWSENTSTPTPDPKTISSIGIGLRWDPNSKVRGQLYWGYALRNVATGAEHDLQDDGISFRLDIQLL